LKKNVKEVVAFGFGEKRYLQAEFTIITMAATWKIEILTAALFP
jgi:hypothetical protein